MISYEAATDNFSNYKQTVEYTLQFKQYIGTFRTTIGGNARGRDIMDWDFENCWLSVADVINFDFDEDEDENLISVILTDPATGETCEIEGTPAEFNEYIVKAEIIEAVKK